MPRSNAPGTRCTPGTDGPSRMHHLRQESQVKTQHCHLGCSSSYLCGRQGSYRNKPGWRKELYVEIRPFSAQMIGVLFCAGYQFGPAGSGGQCGAQLSLTFPHTSPGLYVGVHFPSERAKQCCDDVELSLGCQLQDVQFDRRWHKALQSSMELAAPRYCT